MCLLNQYHPPPDFLEHTITYSILVDATIVWYRHLFFWIGKVAHSKQQNMHSADKQQHTQRPSQNYLQSHFQ